MKTYKRILESASSVTALPLGKTTYRVTVATVAIVQQIVKNFIWDDMVLNSSVFVAVCIATVGAVDALLRCHPHPNQSLQRLHKSLSWPVPQAGHSEGYSGVSTIRQAGSSGDQKPDCKVQHHQSCSDCTDSDWRGDCT